jgi:glycosyltransferase involved in cell wall biosynthesis
MKAAVPAPRMQEGTERKVRIALVAHGIHEYGGNDRTLWELIRSKHAEFEFVVVSSRVPDELRPHVEWHRLPLPERPAPARVALFFLLGGLALRRTTVDLVHTQGAIVPNRVDVATIHFCHAGFREATGRLSSPALPPLRRLNQSIFRLLCIAAERWCYQPGRTRALAAVSQGVASEVRGHYPGIPVAVTPNGVDLDRFRPEARARGELRSAERVGPDDVVMLLVGGDWEGKGLALAIAGLADAIDSARVPLWLWVVGRGSESRFRSLARRRNVADRVRFLGQRLDVERFYQAADVFVLPSLYETFSLVAHEAAASGLPIIATDVSGVSELIGHEEAGVVVERSSSDLARALISLTVDPERRSRLGRAARARASAFTWRRSVDSVAAVYQDLLGDARMARV